MGNKVNTFCLMLVSFFGFCQGNLFDIKPVVQEGHTSPVLSLAISNDDKLLCSISADNRIIVWEVATGNVFAFTSIPNQKNQIESASILDLSFSADSRVIQITLDDRSFNFNLIENSWGTDSVIVKLTKNKRKVMRNGSEVVCIDDNPNKGFRLLKKTEGTIDYVQTCRYFDREFLCVATDRNFQKILAGSSDNRVYIFDFEHGKTLAVKEDNSGYVNHIVVSNNNKYYFSCSSDRSIKMHDLENFSLIKVFYKDLAAKTALSLTADCKKLYLGNERGEIYRIELESNKFDHTFRPLHKRTVRNIEPISEATLFSSSDEGQIKISDYESGNHHCIKSIRRLYNPSQWLYLLGTLKYHREAFKSSNYSLFRSNVVGLRVWWKPSPLKDKLKWSNLYLDTNGKKVKAPFSMCSEQLAPILLPSHLSSGSQYLQQNLRNHLRLADNKVTGHIYSISEDGIVYIWNRVTGELVAQVLVEKGKKIIILPDGYYMSTAKALELIGYRKGMELFNPDQFDLKYNRPDIVLKRLRNTDSALVSSYYIAYQKRLKKMGFTESMLGEDFNLPVLEISNSKNISPTTDLPEILLDIKMRDTVHNLNRINIWINDVPVFGHAGISLSEKPLKEVSQRIKLELIQGKNKIQASVLNEAGAESYRKTIFVEFIPKQQLLPELYLITIGVSKYKDTRFNLEYAAKDAQDIRNLFQQKSEKRYAKVHSYNYLNEEVNRDNILELKNVLQKAKRSDVVIITVSGHGVLDKNYSYYLATHDMDFGNPIKKGLLYEEIEQLLNGISPLQKVLLIDACHSGEVDPEEVIQTVAVANNNTNIKFRNAGAAYQKKATGLRSTSEIMSELFTDLRRGTGATIISSSAGIELSMESGDWKNGLFTYCFLHGIKDGKADLNSDGKIMLSEIQSYLSATVLELSNGQQQPTSRTENITMDFRVW